MKAEKECRINDINPLICFVISLLLFVIGSVSKAVIVTDHPSPFDAQSVANVVTGNAPLGGTGLMDRISLDYGDTVWQSFTLPSAITIDSLYIGYNDQRVIGTITLAIDAGNDGTNDYTFTNIALAGLQPGGGNDGPVHYLQFDVSTENITLAAGQHRYVLIGTSENGQPVNGTGFIMAPIRNKTNTYAGGQSGTNAANDEVFAITSKESGAVPAAAVIAAPANGARGLEGGVLTLDWVAGADPAGAANGYLVTCEQNLNGVVSILADAVALPVSTTEYAVTVAAEASFAWRIDTTYRDYPSNPTHIVTGTLWTFDTITPSTTDLKIDFTQTGGAAAAGWQGYFANHEILSSFTEQSYLAFGRSISILPTWAAGAANATSQMYDRGGDDGTDAEDLLRDWIGTDARQAGDPMTLTIRGLPAGRYAWKSYHHDTHDQTGSFDVTVNDALGSTIVRGIDITSGSGDDVRTLSSVATFSTVISSDGVNPVTLTFDCRGLPTDPVSRVFFVMNGFELFKTTIATAPSPASGTLNVDVFTGLTWQGPTKYAASSYDVYFGTDPNPYSNPKYTVTAESFSLAAELAYDTVYYWQVDSYDGTTQYAGSLWSFTTNSPARPVDLVAGNMIMINDNAGWCWYQDEKIIYDPAVGSVLTSTAANYLGIGGIPRDGDIDTMAFNIATGSRTRIIMGDHPSYGYGDDHNMGALWIRPDGRYLHMYTGHNESTRNNYYRISSFPHDAGAWDPETYYNWYAVGNPDFSASVTYSNLLYLVNEGTGMGRLYNISREAQLSPNIAYSDDWGETWHYAGKLSLTKTGTSYSNGYYKFVSNGRDRIDFIGTEHHPRDYNTSVYHGYIKGGKSYNSFGAVIDSNIFDEVAPAPEDFTPVFVASPEDGINDSQEYHRGWTTEIQLDGQGRPVVLYTTRYGTQIADSRSGDADHRLFYARFDGSQWQSTELAKMGRGLHNGEQDYTGLGAIHPNNPDIIYISTPFDPRNNAVLGNHEIFKGITRDQGASWQWTQITFDSTVDNLRPAIPAWDANNTAVFWLRGYYPWQRDYDETLVGLIDRLGESSKLITYIDATVSNTVLTDGSPLAATGPANGSGAANDNLWHEQMSFGNGDGCYMAGENSTENAPVLKTTITGLQDGIYDIFAYFWADPDEDWRISGGFSQSDMLVFRRKSSQQAQSVQFNNSVSMIDGSVALYRAYIGRKEVVGGNSIDVYIDDVPGTKIDGSQRTVYDGLGAARVILGDFTDDNQVDLQDVAEISQGWQLYYSFKEIMDIVEYWLN